MSAGVASGVRALHRCRPPIPASVRALEALNAATVAALAAFDLARVFAMAALGYDANASHVSMSPVYVPVESVFA